MKAASRRNDRNLENDVPMEASFCRSDMHMPYGDYLLHVLGHDSCITKKCIAVAKKPGNSLVLSQEGLKTVNPILFLKKDSKMADKEGTRRRFSVP